MPNTEQVIVKLDLVTRSDNLTTLKPLKVTIQRATRRNQGTPLPYVPADQDDVPQDCRLYLQVWEINKFESSRGGNSSNPPRPQGAPPPQQNNELLVEIPGFVKQTASGASTYEFRVLGAPTFGTGTECGYFILTLRDPQGQPWQNNGRALIVPIRGQAEDECDLGVALEQSAGQTTHRASAWQRASCLHLTNLTHIIGAMLEEGGLTLAFNIKNNPDSADLDRHDWCRTHSPPMRNADGSKNARGERSGRYIADIINDDEFNVQGVVFARRFHSLALQNGELILATTKFTNGWQEIATNLDQIRTRVHQDMLSGQGDKPKVKRLAILTHGMPNGILVARQDRWMGMRDAPNMIAAFAPHCTDDILLTLFACSTGYGGSSDSQFGFEAGETRRLGQGSFAELCCKLLKDNGCTHAAVWGHTTAAHTTQNPRCRAFYAGGGGEWPQSADLIWFAQQPPPRRDPVISSWVARAARHGDDIMQMSILHPGSQVSSCASTGCHA